MKRVESTTGEELRNMFQAATSWFEKSAQDIDVLNVFPVPDGDTGTNMLLTMRSAVDEAHRAPDGSAGAIARAVSRGALMGARGNSGVILSQIWRGFAGGLAEKDSFNAADLATAFAEAATTAYNGISNPVEGTILTVIKDTAHAAGEAAQAEGADIVSVMEASLAAARESVANTPRLLAVLREAGVVDAGGQGLYTLLEGAHRYLTGEAEQSQFRKPQIIVSDLPITKRFPQAAGVEEIPFGYCTEFLLKGEKLDTEKIKKRLEKKGQSLIVVGDQSAIRVHIHTSDPGKVIQYATGLGTVHQASMRNMDEQHQDWIEQEKEQTPTADMAIVAVVAGDGLADVFTSLGASYVVPGGQTMNPSTKDILQAVEAVDSEKIILLPNNKNIVLTAEQIPELTKKSVEIVPTTTIPQGVSALLAFDYEVDLHTNADIMKNAIGLVKSIEITRAVRATQIGNLKINKKQPVGLLDGALMAVGADDRDVLHQILQEIDMTHAEVVTVYFGEDATTEGAEALSQSVTEAFTTLQVEVVHGGQPHYDYIISVE
ncbi:DAK2 domain-containing protein [Chloroflexota bacterium]